jgi:transcriptional regulator with XRE-family HTH domain
MEVVTMTTATKPDTPGRRMRRARQWAGFDNQSEIADALGVTRQSVSLWESDRQAIDRRTALALQALTGVTAGWLLMEEGGDLQTSSDESSIHSDMPPGCVADRTMDGSTHRRVEGQAA